MKAKRDISVYSFVPYAPGTTPSQRFRIEQWLPHLLAEGINVRFVPFADESLMERLRQPGKVFSKISGLFKAFTRSAVNTIVSPWYDVILIHRAICIAGPAVLERFLYLTRVPVIYDFDDAIWLLHTSAANQRFGWLKCPAKTSVICRLSARVVVGNRYLQDYAKLYNRRVTVIPSSVDTDLFCPQYRSNRKDHIVIGWTGSSTSQTHLELFVPMLRKVCSIPGVQLRVHSDREPILPGVRFIWRPWSASTEKEEISSFDIGIMPMPNDPWSRGKCAMKALLYMAMGIPTVCSPVGTNCEVIRHGENGLLAKTPDEWITSLTNLAKNADFRSRIGNAGRRTVEEHYSTRHCAAHFAKIVREVIARRSEAL